MLAIASLPRRLFPAAGTVALIGLLSIAVSSATLAQETALEREAADDLLHGRVSAAQELFADIAAARGFGVGWAAQPWKHPWEPGEARWLARLNMRQGNWAAARQLLLPQAAGKRPQLKAALLLAEVEREAGHGDVRVELLTRTLAAWPGEAQVAVALGEQLLEMGNRVAGTPLLDALPSAWEEGKLRQPLDAVAVGRALLLTGYPKDALDVLTGAEQDASEPADVLAVQLALGELFLSKYNYRDADIALRKVLKIDPTHPLALAAMGQIDLASDSDVAQARGRAEQLLSANPNLPEGLVLRAEVAMQDEDWPVARAMVQRALALRSDSLRARYLQGALAKITDDAQSWTEAERAVRKVNRDNGELYLEAAEHLVVNHRYADAQALLKTALQRDGDLWRAHAALGVAWARVADDVKAKKSLETAFAGDPYDVRTANQLHILYDDVLQHMTLVPGALVDLRVHNRERKGLEPSLAPFLQTAVQQLSRLYGFVPKKPLQVEVFPDVQAFSVRTVGLPRLGAHAVCFGHLVTSRSPVTEPFNWKMVLYHELSHVFHLQATDGRVPRWLTEGLAMMEAAWLDSRYQQHDDRGAWDRLREGRLAKLETFNLAFSQARSLQDILGAYDQAMREVQFLAQRYGVDKVRKLVLGHQPGKTTSGLLREILGKEPAQLDAEFAEWLGQDLAKFSNDFRPNWTATAKRLGVPDGATAIPPQRDAVRTALADAVVATHAHQDPRPALARAVAAGSAVGLAPDSWVDTCTAQALRLELEVEASQRKTAGEVAAWLVAQPGGRCDGVQARVVLATLAAAAKDPRAAVAQLWAARRIDPADPGALRRWQAALSAALPALGAKPNGGPQSPEAQAWMDALSSGKYLDFLELLHWSAAAEMHLTQPVEDLAQAAWPLARDATEAAVRGPAQRALDDAAAWYDERAPAHWRAPLWLARAQAAHGQARVAMPLYRSAAERSPSERDRRAIWCEVAEVAASAGLSAERAEALRRCPAAVPAADDPNVQGRAPRPPPVDQPGHQNPPATFVRSADSG